ncbi:MAG TPA: hypothetical protein VJP40_06025 [bacterium]|nr:hypothetical protein [bacterium]
MSIIIDDFENPYTLMLRERFRMAQAEQTLVGENPYRRKLQELCSIPNPYRAEPACQEVQQAKDEFIPNPYRSDERQASSRPRRKRLQVFDTPNPYR